MEDQLLIYDEVLRQTDERRHLLLGNGFSMAYDKNRFSFTSLLQSAIDKDIIKENSNIHQIFKNNNTSDFEEVIKILENTSKILKIYTQNESLCEQLLEDSKKLKQFLVDIVTNNHPEKITEIPDNKFDSTIEFIKSYDKIYSLNYDLLLYWATEKLREKINNKIIQDKTEFIDGFHNSDNGNDVVFDNNSHGNTCFYLHGALHIFDSGDEIIKKTYSRTGRPLKEQITEELNSNRYPVFVSEGTSEQKKTKIIHNAYLNHCYKSLSSIGGNLIVFGTMLKSNDEHIQDAILKSRVTNIYFGVSSLEKGQKDLNSFIEKNNNLEKNRKQIFFYDYRTVRIWQNKD
ncbi:DUF4917 family protein [Campylobacter jejuni]|uniref:DUF4917 family protein n=1 Tax=Campylobacter jejuni TaxID=197 RepID=UPI0012C225DD|nr:DUF4917 family protein [Campylobacter jejuni]HEB9289246.1 DUF4917 family protein [Campylobacter coli]EAL6236980.1 DUF4917 family protein [Campylobacter jejuni]ECJ8326295.1 DUF4917 family protein [Campylobacter jejuni]ECP8999234.1 DUF4917 family protein [Campylobacter jejuni]ECQ8820336.1 DUF4917 family protein [Campylobacter jejuni]